MDCGLAKGSASLDFGRGAYCPLWGLLLWGFRGFATRRGLFHLVHVGGGGLGVGFGGWC